MSLFRKIFGSKSKNKEEELKPGERGKYMPEIKLPIDEKFTINFKANGGKFETLEDYRNSCKKIFVAIYNSFCYNNFVFDL